MKRRFVMITDPLTADQDGRIAAAFEQPIRWWRHLPNAWLVVDESGQLTAEALRGLLAQVAPGAKMFAVEISPGAWWSARLSALTPGQRRWLEEHWDTD